MFCVFALFYLTVKIKILQEKKEDLLKAFMNHVWNILGLANMFCVDFFYVCPHWTIC